jgi:hypothetical protein
MSSIRNKSLTTTGKAGGTIQPGSLTEAASKNAVNSQRKFINNVKDRIAEGRYNEVDFTADLRMINKLIGDICKDENKEVTAQSDLDSYFKGASKSQSEMEAKNQIQALQDLAVEIVRAGKNQVKGNRDKVKEKLEEHINDLISSPEDSEESSEKSSVKTSKDNIKVAMILELNNNLTLEVRDEASSESGAKSPKVDQWLFMRLRIHRIVDKPESESVGGAAPVVGGEVHGDVVASSTQALQKPEEDPFSQFDVLNSNESDKATTDPFEVFNLANSEPATGSSDDPFAQFDINQNVSPQELPQENLLSVSISELTNDYTIPTQAPAQAPSKSSPANAGELPTAIVESVLEESSQAGVAGGVDGGGGRVQALNTNRTEIVNKCKEVSETLANANISGDVKRARRDEVIQKFKELQVLISDENSSNLDNLQASSLQDSFKVIDLILKGDANRLIEESKELNELSKIIAKLDYDKANLRLLNAKNKFSIFENRVAGRDKLSDTEVKELEDILKEVAKAEAERNRCAKDAILTQEEKIRDVEEDKNFKLQMQKFFMKPLGQDALSRFEPEFSDKIVNMYLGGLSTKFVFSEIFDKFFKESIHRSREDGGVDLLIEALQKLVDANKDRKIVDENIKVSEESKINDFKFFKMLKDLSEKNNTEPDLYKKANIILAKLIMQNC